MSDEYQVGSGLIYGRFPCLQRVGLGPKVLTRHAHILTDRSTSKELGMRTLAHMTGHEGSPKIVSELSSNSLASGSDHSVALNPGSEVSGSSVDAHGGPLETVLGPQ